MLATRAPAKAPGYRSLVDPYFAAAGAAWDAGPKAGEWIAPLLAEFGATLGHAVPGGYASYAVVPIADDDRGRQDHAVLDAVLASLAPSTGEQLVHVGLWEGWGWLYDHGDDPRTAPGMGAFGLVVSDGVWTSDAESTRAAVDAMARKRVARPDAAPLELPHRRYFLWSGPLASATALRHAGDIPSLIWPDDRAWFVGAPIYTRELALGGDAPTVGAVVDALSARGARTASRDEVLDIDD